MRNGCELVPGLLLPPAYEAALRRRMGDIDQASSAANCLIALARAEGLVDALEILTPGISSAPLERLYVRLEDAAAARLLELEREP